MNFLKSITGKQWLIIIGVIVLIIIIVLIAKNAKKSGELANQQNAQIVNPYVLTPYAKVST